MDVLLYDGMHLHTEGRYDLTILNDFVQALKGALCLRPVGLVDSFRY